MPPNNPGALDDTIVALASAPGLFGGIPPHDSGVAEPQVVPVQMNCGPRQSVLAVQLVLQAPVPQRYGLHELVVGVTQTLLVLQVEAGVSVEPVQVGSAHFVPAAYLRQ